MKPRQMSGFLSSALSKIIQWPILKYLKMTLVKIILKKHCKEHGYKIRAS